MKPFGKTRIVFLLVAGGTAFALVGGVVPYTRHHTQGPKPVHRRVEHFRFMIDYDREIGLVFGDTLPEFDLPTVLGDTVRSADLRGKPALFLFLPHGAQLSDPLLAYLAEIRSAGPPNLQLFLIFREFSPDDSAKIDPDDFRGLAVRAVVLPAERADELFRVPGWSCAFVLFVDRFGIVRLGVPGIGADELKTIVARYDGSAGRTGAAVASGLPPVAPLGRADSSARSPGHFSKPP